jgi:hypothetical protein
VWGGFSFSVDRAGEWAEEGTSKKVRRVLATFKRTGIRLRISEPRGVRLHTLAPVLRRMTNPVSTLKAVVMISRS